MKLFGYSISINVLILIGVLYLIMTVNAVSGSCNREGMNFKDRDRFRERKETYEDKMGGLLVPVIFVIVIEEWIVIVLVHLRWSLWLIFPY